MRGSLYSVADCMFHYYQSDLWKIAAICCAKWNMYMLLHLMEWCCRFIRPTPEDKPQHHDKRCDKMFNTVDWSLWHARFQIRQCTWSWRQTGNTRPSGVAMAEAFRLEVKGWNDSFLPLEDELMSESVSRPIIASSSMQTCDWNKRRTVGQKALSLSLKG